MMSKIEKVTAIIPCFNEENTIAKCIESVLWADEILVVDSFSTDKTPEIVKSFPKVTFVQHEYINSATQKNWIIPQAKNNWIFLLDADEYAPEKLINEVNHIIHHQPKHDAYWIYRNSIFMNKLLKHTWKHDRVIRLFKRDTCKYQDLHVHSEVETTGTVGVMKNKIIHDTYKDWTTQLKKGERYTTWGAYDRVDKIEKVTLYHLMFKPAFAFFREYVLRLGFLDGKQGFIIASLTGWNVFNRFVKIISIHKGEKFKR